MGTTSQPMSCRNWPYWTTNLLTELAQATGGETGYWQLPEEVQVRFRDRVPMMDQPIMFQKEFGRFLKAGD